MKSPADAGLFLLIALFKQFILKHWYLFISLLIVHFVNSLLMFGQYKRKANTKKERQQLGRSHES
ncbi:hypothetical protein SAMN05660429_00680 [Thalassotalea agarivorans]|uniref:Uncharacterized protein n=1 Tax=Thalassotalea agarivorans TaxID=349064 RepID=A0A1I0AEJ5_THASX|nr:hypothetical protein SAMN05660429_00680 [Thalassotalea agarivorans]